MARDRTHEFECIPHPRRWYYWVVGEDFPRETAQWFTNTDQVRRYIARERVLGGRPKHKRILVRLCPIDPDPIVKRKDGP